MIMQGMSECLKCEINENVEKMCMEYKYYCSRCDVYSYMEE